MAKDKKKKNFVREYTEAILVALVAAMILRIFVIQAFRSRKTRQRPAECLHPGTHPMEMMKDTLLIGDFLLVNKFIYGVRTPDRIPLIDVKIPYVRLPGFKEPNRGDIVVFKYPLDEKLDYIKRCVATEGQTVEVREGDLYVDGELEGQEKFVKKVYE